MEKEEALRRLKVGDLIHSGSADGPSRICLVAELTQTHIVTRSITTQEELFFCIESGAAVPWQSEWPLGVTCVEPLPQATYDILMGLNDRYAGVANDGDYRLSASEVRALSIAGNHCKRYPFS